MVLEIVVLNLAITLLEGWFQLESTVGNADSPQKGIGLFGDGLFQESLVQRKVARLDLVMS